MNKQQAIQFLTKELEKAKQLIQAHVAKFGDDYVVLLNIHKIHPEKWNRHTLNSNALKLSMAIEELKKEDTYLNASLSLTLIVGEEELQFHGIDSKRVYFPEPPFDLKKAAEFLEKLEFNPKFNNNTFVRLTGYPNGIEERRGLIGHKGKIVDCSYGNGDTFSGIPKGYSYLVQSSSFQNAIARELWVHEDNLEQIDGL